MSINYEMYFTDYTTSLYDPGNRLKRRNIMRMLPRITNKKILDVGGGEWRYSIRLHKSRSR